MGATFDGKVAIFKGKHAESKMRRPYILLNFPLSRKFIRGVTNAVAPQVG